MFIDSLYEWLRIKSCKIFLESCVCEEVSAVSFHPRNQVVVYFRHSNVTQLSFHNEDLCMPDGKQWKISNYILL